MLTPPLSGLSKNVFEDFGPLKEILKLQGFMFILKEVNYFCKTFKLNSSDLKGLC